MTADTHFVSPNTPTRHIWFPLYMQMVLNYDFLNSRRFRTNIETRGSLLKGMPETPDRIKDGQLALESFPDIFDILSPL